MTSHAAAVDQIMTMVHVLSVVLFVGWVAYFAYVLVRFRSGRQPHAQRPARAAQESQTGGPSRAACEGVNKSRYLHGVPVEEPQGCRRAQRG